MTTRLPTAPTRDHRGKRNPNRVLTLRLVKEALRLHARGYGYGKVAAHLGVTKSCVQMLLTGRSWAHVTGLRPPSRAGG